MWLFDTSNYVPRAVCGNWPEWLIAVDVLANIVIAAAYIGIPVVLGFLWFQKRKVLPHAHVVALFCGFIAWCGMTHVLDATLFYWPVYNLNAVVNIITATISMIAFAYLPAAVLYFMDFKTPKEYKDLADKYYEELKLERTISTDLESTMDFLQHRISRLEGEMKHKDWIDKQNLRLDELKEKLEGLSKKYKETFVRRKNGAA